MSRSGTKDGGIDQLFTGPDSGNRIEAVGQRLAKDDDVRLHVKVLHRPHLSGAIEAHLDLIIEEQYSPFAANGRQALEISFGGHVVASGALDRLDEKSAELGVTGLW